MTVLSHNPFFLNASVTFFTASSIMDTIPRILEDNLNGKGIIKSYTFCWVDKVFNISDTVDLKYLHSFFGLYFECSCTYQCILEELVADHAQIGRGDTRTKAKISRS